MDRLKIEGSIEKGGRFTHIGPADMFSLEGKVAEGRLNFIDVRKVEEFNNYHLEGAKVMPVDDLERTFGDLDREKATLIYCKIGKRCLKAAEILADKGFHDIYVLDGGLDGYLEYLKRSK